MASDRGLYCLPVTLLRVSRKNGLRINTVIVMLLGKTQEEKEGCLCHDMLI